MSKSEIKELLIILLCGILNTIIAFTITGFCGTTNTVLARTYCYGDITVEIIISMSLMFVEALFYEYF